MKLTTIAGMLNESVKKADTYVVIEDAGQEIAVPATQDGCVDMQHLISIHHCLNDDGRRILVDVDGTWRYLDEGVHE